MNQTVMILGCGRSGTSILGELFQSLRPYRYLSEPPFSRLATWDFTRPLAVKVPRESKGYPPSPGLSFPLETFLSMAGPLILFWIVRHPLDTIASLRPGIARDWGHHPRPPDWRSWQGRPLNEQCAHHWAFINTAGYEQVSDRAMVLRFEDMIDHPLDFARRVAASVGAEADGVGAWARRVGDRYDPAQEAATSRPYTLKTPHRRIGRWREELGPGDLARVLPIVAPAARAFGYGLPSETMP